MSPHRLFLFAGEFPPELGGVSDHTRMLAEVLESFGIVPVVLCGGSAGHSQEWGVRVHRVAGGFGPMRWPAMARVLEGGAGRRAVWVQYAPHSMGLRGMNIPLALWLAWRAWFHGDRLVVYFHEVAFPFRGPWRHRLLSVAQNLMAGIVAASASVALVTTQAWLPRLAALGVRPCAVKLLPVFSNLPEEVNPGAVEARRARWLAETGADRLVAHFGTYGGGVGALMVDTLAAFPRHSRAVFLLLGRRAAAWLANHAREPWALRCRVVNETDSMALAETLAACDAALQPYPDGVTTRRTTVMSALALGVPVVSNLGPLSDRCWAAESPCAGLAPRPEGEELAGQLAGLLNRQPSERANLGTRGRAWYRQSASRAVAAQAVAGIVADLS